jgi:hypothetical protein
MRSQDEEEYRIDMKIKEAHQIISINMFLYAVPEFIPIQNSSHLALSILHRVFLSTWLVLFVATCTAFIISFVSIIFKFLCNIIKDDEEGGNRGGRGSLVAMNSVVYL